MKSSGLYFFLARDICQYQWRYNWVPSMPLEETAAAEAQGEAEAPGAGREALVRADGRGEFEACPELMT